MHRTIIASLFSSLALLAQVNTGSISGYVLDPSGKAIPGAGLTLEDTARSLTRSIQSSPAGYYEFDGLPPAEYRLSVNAASFAQLTTQAIRVEVDQRVRLDLHTTLAGRGEHIAVTARAAGTSNDS